MGGPEKPTLTQEQITQQRLAEAERIDGIRDRVGDETRDLLIRFGRRRALTGGSGSATPAASVPGSLGLFGGRKLQAIGGL